MPSTSIGLVLSGGGARGLTHVGVLKALEELGITISEISGTSAGAIIGGMYAAGLAPDDILHAIQSQRFLSLRSFSLKPHGFFSARPLVQLLQQNLPVTTFEQLRYPLYVTATNIQAGETTTFSKGDIIMPIVASSAVPLMFAPVKINGGLYLDGGVINNFPVEPLRHCDVLIGSNVSNWPDNHQHWTRMQIAQRCFHLGMNQYMVHKSKLCRVFINPPVGHYNGFGKRKLRELASLGYQYAMEQKEELLACASEKTDR